MRVVIVYESMFGNTGAIAEAIAEGCRPYADVRVVAVADADAVGLLEGADLLLVGGPTHVRGMSRPSTRKGAPDYVRRPGADLVLRPGVDTGPGVREWLNSLTPSSMAAAAFDTRVKAPAVFTGRASKSIGRKLESQGFTLVMPPESFLVDKTSHLLPGETDRARAWAAGLVARREDANSAS